MKKISTLFLLLLSLSLSAQEPMSLESPEFEAYFLDGKNIPKLSGQIINADPETLARLSLEFHFASPDSRDPGLIYIQPSVMGCFSVPVHHAFPYYQVRLQIKLYDLIIYSGSVLLNDSLNLMLDYNLLSARLGTLPEHAIVYSGSDALLNKMDQEHLHTIWSEFYLSMTSAQTSNLPLDQRLQVLNQLFEERKKKEELFLEKYQNQHRAFYESKRKSEFYQALFMFNDSTIPADFISEFLNYKPIGTTPMTFDYYFCLLSYLQSVGQDEISPLLQDLRLLRSRRDFAWSLPEQYQKCIPKIQTKWLRHYAETELAWLESLSN
ncbi:MAG: hypothetical protein R2792_05320 [Saprospiraceae bacterium]